MTSINSNVSLAKSGDSIRITTAGASDLDTVDTYLLGCGETPGNWNLCTGSAGTGQRTCDFQSPWDDNINHTVYCTISDTHDNSSEYNVNITADNTDPTVTIYFPENITYNTILRDLNYSATDLHIDTAWYDYNNINTTLTSNTTFTALDNQQSTLIIWANDTVGNLNSAEVTFTVDTIPPQITIINPDNKSYNTPIIWFYPQCITGFI